MYLQYFGELYDQGDRAVELAPVQSSFNCAGRVLSRFNY